MIIVFSEYDFMADYIEKLKKAGIDGQISDIEKLQKTVLDLDPKVQEGLERSIAMYGVNFYL